MILKSKRIVRSNYYIVILTRGLNTSGQCSGCKFEELMKCTRIYVSSSERLVDVCGENTCLLSMKNYTYRVIRYVKKEV